MVIIPLVVTSIISGVASVGGGRDLGRLFSKTLGFYIFSSALAMRTFSSAVIEAPGLCSPSRRVVSKIISLSLLMVMLFLCV